MQPCKPEGSKRLAPALKKLCYLEGATALEKMEEKRKIGKNSKKLKRRTAE
jgi:hypothetical protein